VFPRLALLLFVLIQPAELDRYSLDHVLQRGAARTPRRSGH
jgi:hypothetical protein